ncbi:MAG TPA: diacylglycerol kinase family protein [Acidimicrobiales bacterium]|nr:diacylglycerol kinase family protein [Acidimicrobiales bacterium]
MRLVLVVNTSASSVTHRTRVVIQRALSAEHDVAIATTNRRGHATRLAQGAASDGADVVVVLGGDGTLNEAANGLAGSATALAVVPGGSTNVFARTIGAANDPLEATAQVIAALGAGSVRRVGLGQANGRYFLFHAGIGFDAAVVAKVEKMAVLKRYAGPAVFLAATASTLARRYSTRGPRFDISSGDFSATQSPFAICLNTSPYTFLGPRPVRVAPGTTLDGPLSLVAFEDLRLPTLAPMAWAALSHQGAGSGVSQRAHVIAGVHEVRVGAARPVDYQLDGDHIGYASNIDLRWEPDALDLVFPLPGNDA